MATHIKEHTDLKYIIEFELADSHINIKSRMVVISCKYEIDNSKNFMLDNPNLIYPIDKNTTYYSRDKGFIIALSNAPLEIKVLLFEVLFYFFKTKK